MKFYQGFKMILFINPLFFKKTIPYSYTHSIVKINNYIIPQIRAYHSFGTYEQDLDAYRYGTKGRRKLKSDLFLPGFIEDHHIIPRRFRNYDIIKECKYDVNSCNNILMMPSLCASNMIEDKSILYHTTHPKYNSYIEENLIFINKMSKTNEEKQYNLWLFIKDTEYKIVSSDKKLPWL